MSNRVPSFLSAALVGCWALEPNTFSMYAAAMQRRYLARNAGALVGDAFGQPSGPGYQAARSAPIAGGASKRNTSGAIAVIPVSGVLMQHAGMMEACGGGTSTDTITQALRAALADDTVGQILLQIDSPGGSVFGIGELATEIRDARATKPIVGVANSMAASAAYWIGSACSELYCVPGGQVGSIGVIAAHENVAKALEAEGIAVTLITAGKYKAEGNPYGPLDAESLASIQADVDGYYADFTSAIAKGRGVSVEAVRKDMGQGRMLRGPAAQAVRMIDGVATVDQVVKRMQRNAKADPAPGGQPTMRGAGGTPRLARAQNELALLEAGSSHVFNVDAARRELNRIAARG